METEIKTATVKREHFTTRRSGAFTYVAIQDVHLASIYRASSVMVDGVLASQHSPIMVTGEQLGTFPTQKAALEAIAAFINDYNAPKENTHTAICTTRTGRMLHAFNPATDLTECGKTPGAFRGFFGMPVPAMGINSATGKPYTLAPDCRTCAKVAR